MACYMKRCRKICEMIRINFGQKHRAGGKATGPAFCTICIREGGRIAIWHPTIVKLWITRTAQNNIDDLLLLVIEKLAARSLSILFDLVCHCRFLCCPCQPTQVDLISCSRVEAHKRHKGNKIRKDAKLAPLQGQTVEAGEAACRRKIRIRVVRGEMRCLA
jgi:hypothetical protein